MEIKVKVNEKKYESIKSFFSFFNINVDELIEKEVNKFIDTLYERVEKEIKETLREKIKEIIGGIKVEEKKVEEKKTEGKKEGKEPLKRFMGRVHKFEVVFYSDEDKKVKILEDVIRVLREEGYKIPTWIRRDVIIEGYNTVDSGEIHIQSEKKMTDILKDMMGILKEFINKNRERYGLKTLFFDVNVI